MRQTSTARQTQESPARNSYAVTPHDSDPVGDFLPRALYVGVGGDITMALEGDDATLLFRNVPSGSVLPVKPRLIAATGTTATALVALY